MSGSLQNVVQSTDEVKGVAEAFDDLGEELTNNRIDNPDLQEPLGGTNRPAAASNCRAAYAAT